MNIKEASQITGVSSETIRYYEKIGLVPPIDRKETGVRDIDERIIRRINFARQMRSAGMSVENLQKYIQLFDANENNQQEQLDLLQEQLEVLEEKRDDLTAAINHLTFKLANHGKHMTTFEEELHELEQQQQKHPKPLYDDVDVKK
ncbi:MerR family transcriptional regulator [Paucilactobacillus nenjiangensis]|uniref:MerR family transcriptional regulator n=1 Tax=Paucilactobacillus nenjiangensis TaxID=1296540 RepID=UPI003BB0C395